MRINGKCIYKITRSIYFFQDGLDLPFTLTKEDIGKYIVDWKLQDTYDGPEPLWKVHYSRETLDQLCMMLLPYAIDYTVDAQLTFRSGCVTATPGEWITVNCFGNIYTYETEPEDDQEIFDR